MTITKERAKEIAVQHAGYTADKVTFVKTELDHDDGLAEYEIEFLADGKKFDIKINAENGGVLETEVGG